ncbi:MAG: ATP-binding cassette domain-containing protein [Nocardioidaceae bacterium]|nr:ATP-binding cassette domain-containing protein [Nocardioidaceae bacterium]
MTGFVGANGAGKTTSMRIIMGVLAATAGQVHWRGEPVRAEQRRSFGYMPEERGLYPKMQVAEQLRYFARLHGADTAEAGHRTDMLLDRLELGDRGGDVLETLSLGNQQRVQVAAALVHEPAALVLDEPFRALDPLAVDVMTGLLREQVEAGVPVLFSSHQLELVERICDDLVIIAGGRIVATGTVEELRRSEGDAYSLHITGHADLDWVSGIDGVRVLDVDAAGVEQIVVFEADREGAAHDVLREALGRGTVQELSRRAPTLAEIFRETVA